MINDLKIRNSNLKHNAIWGMLLSVIFFVVGISNGQLWVIGLGVLGFIICLALWFFMTQRINNLKRNGYKIVASIDYISLNIRPASKSAKWAYSLVCSGVSSENNQRLEFQSEEFHNGQPFVDFQSKPTLDVYVDKNDQKNYYVDISKIKPDNASKPFADNPPFGFYRSQDGKHFEMVK